MRTLRWFLFTVLLSPYLLLRCRARKGEETSYLIIQLGKIGDVLCTAIMCRTIKATQPNATVHMLILRGSQGAIADNPHIDHIHLLEDQPRLDLIRSLKDRIDCTINVMPGSFASILGLWIGSSTRINTSSKAHGLLVRVLNVFSTQSRPYQIRTSTYEHYMALLRFLDIDPLPYTVDFFVQKSHEESLDTWLQKHSLVRGSYLVCNITAGNRIKEWPIEKWAAFCDATYAKYQLPIVLSTIDADRIATVKDAAVSETMLIDGSSLSLPELKPLCEGAAAYVSCDTGPMYIAHASGVPIVILLGPIHPAEQVPPESEKVAHIHPPEGCEPWVFISLTPREGTDAQLRCIRDTSIESVLRGLSRVIRVHS